jgi:hypothetical protein
MIHELGGKMQMAIKTINFREIFEFLHRRVMYTSPDVPETHILQLSLMYSELLYFEIVLRVGFTVVT